MGGGGATAEGGAGLETGVGGGGFPFRDESSFNGGVEGTWEDELGGGGSETGVGGGGLPFRVESSFNGEVEGEDGGKTPPDLMV